MVGLPRSLCVDLDPGPRSAPRCPPPPPKCRYASVERSQWGFPWANHNSTGNLAAIYLMGMALRAAPSQAP